MFDELDNISEGVVESNKEDAITKIGTNRSMLVTTPLLDLTMKSVQVGDVVVRGDRGLFPLNLFNAVADKVVVQISLAVRSLQIAIEGEDAFVDGTAAPVFSMFEVQEALDPNTRSITSYIHMHDKYAHKVTGDKIPSYCVSFAEISVYIDMALALGVQREEMFPHARDRLQLAWNASTNTPISPADGTYEALRKALSVAISYRARSGTGFRAVESNVRSRRAGGGTIKANSSMSATSLLGI